MIEMWKRVIGRASNPTVQIDGYELLSDWAAYIVQLPFYTVNVMNSNSVFQQLFKNGWLADWADYNSSVFYGGSNRYGMGADQDPEIARGKCLGATPKLQAQPLRQKQLVSRTLRRATRIAIARRKTRLRRTSVSCRS
eukprot:g1541.t1